MKFVRSKNSKLQLPYLLIAFALVACVPTDRDDLQTRMRYKDSDFPLIDGYVITITDRTNDIFGELSKGNYDKDDGGFRKLVSTIFDEKYKGSSSNKIYIDLKK